MSALPTPHLPKPAFRFEYQAISAILVLITGTLFYHFIEWWRYLDSLYFSVITATTIGYGDITPQTDAGKIFTIIYVFISIGVLTSFIKEFTRKNQERAKKITKGVRNTVK